MLMFFSFRHYFNSGFALFQVMSLTQNVAALETQIDRITREKISLANQLEEAQNQNVSRDIEVNKVEILLTAQVFT